MMDWKARLRNKTFIVSVVAFVFMILKSIFDITPTPELNMIIDSALAILIGLGVIINPVTKGVVD